MRRWLILGATGVIIAGLFCSLAGSLTTAASSDTDLYPWLSSQGVSILSRGATGAEKEGCSTRSERVLFRDGYGAVGCIYGDSQLLRIVSYTNQGGLSVIGVAFPGEDKYSEIYGVCEGSRFCAYSASRDVLVDSGTGKFYTDFVKNLEKQTNPVNGLPYYHFARSDLSRHISAGWPMIFNAATVSTDGKWAVVEAYEYGFVRVDLDTFHERRIAISGARYGVANDPSFELAISNSGREFAVVGYRTGVSLYEVDNYCGDVLGNQSMYYFLNPSVPCRQASLSTDLFTGFISAHTASFNSNGTRLGLTVKASTGRERVILAPKETFPPDASASQYLALGDSYSSGEGETNSRFYKIGTDQDTNSCHQSARSYPYLLIPLWGVDTGRSVACSGAQIGDISGTGHYYGQKAQVSKVVDEFENITNQALVDFMPGIVRQLRFVEAYQPRVVTIGIGGNDAGLMDKLNSCISFGVCEWARDPAKRIASAKEIQALYTPLRAMITKLQAVNPGATLLFIGYPAIINELQPASCGAPLDLLLSPEERRFMDESIKVLNDTIRAASSAEGVSYIDIQDVFAGHRLCEGDSLAMNGIRLGNDIAPVKGLSILKLIGAESFHPTPFGHALIANRIHEQIPTLNYDSCLGCTVDAEPRELTNYWGNHALGAEVPHLAKNRFLNKETYIPGEPLYITAPSYSFSSGANVEIRFGSNSTLIGSSTASEVGNFTYKVTVPEDLDEGYYTVHFVGLSWSGDLVDAYQVIGVVGRSEAVEPIVNTDNTNSLTIAPVNKMRTTVYPIAQTNTSVLNPIMTEFGQVKGVIDASVERGTNGATGRSAKETGSVSEIAAATIFVVAAVSSIFITIFLTYRYIIRSST